MLSQAGRVAAAALLALAAGARGEAVVDLTDDAFDDFIKTEKHTMVEFFAPWCGHCKSLAPEYEEAAGKLEEHGIKIAKMDATAQTESAKKFDVNGYPTLKVFTDGEAADYNGERKADAIVNFLRSAADPSFVAPAAAADAGWEGDKGNVLHSSDADWDTFRAENPKTLTMFYAPWCGHCKALKPDFAKSSKQIAEAVDSGAATGAAVLSAVDCTVATTVCGKFDVTGYPTLMYFDSAEDEGTKFEQARTAKALTAFCIKKIDTDWKPVVVPFENVEQWKDEEYGNGEVLHLTDEYFDDIRKDSKHLFVMFYAPWCGHCKNLKPDWVEASERSPRSFKFAATDCTDSPDVCGVVGTAGYPTLKYFEPLVDDAKDNSPQSKTGMKYDNMARAVDDLVWFAKDRLDKAARAEAKSVSADTDFSKLKMKALKKLLKDRGETCAGCTDKSEFVARVKEVFSKPVADKPKHKRTMMAEKRYQEAKAAADKGWSDEDHGNGNVKQLIDDDFAEYKDANAPMLTMFYAPWCGHCKTLKPEWVAASEITDLPAKMTAVDCTVNPDVCRKYNAQSYPTLHYFQDKDTDKPLEGVRTAKALEKFLRKELDPSYVEVVQPFRNDEVWKDEDHGNGKVVHLTDEHFGDFRKEHDKMITMFYAPWCGHCKAFKPDLVKASEEVSDDVVISAVDCTVHTEICGKYGVNGYPSIKYFEDSTGEPKEYDGARTKEAVLELAEKIGFVIDKDEL